MTFSIDGNNVSELKQFLVKISSNAEDAPKVVILDNLHHAGKLEDVFDDHLTASFDKGPFIIGTLNMASGNGQQGQNATSLQLRHNFRWVLCANHVEPVKGFLGRYLRQKLLAVEVQVKQ